MPNKIAIIGVGHSNTPTLSQTAQDFLNTATTVFTKLPIPKIVTDFKIIVKHVVPIFNPADGVADGYQGLAQNLVAAAPAALLVPGNPRIDEASLPVISAMAKTANVALEIFDAPDMLLPTLRAFNLSPTAGLQILDATLLCGYHHSPLEPHRPALITGIYHPDLISPIQRVLQTAYPADVPMMTMTASGVSEVSLTNLDESASAIYLPPQTERIGLTAFLETIAHLRAPNGCPWDRKQTHKTLRPYLLEETHEVLMALDSGDLDGVAEELGDVLLQILLHAQIAHEADNFNMSDIVHHINTKIIRRHPHVFGDVSVNSAEEVTANWAVIKAQEKAENGKGNKAPSALDGVPTSLPALSQALNISQKAVDVGFEWQNIEGVLEKLVEEAREIVEADNHDDIESEVGDFLFVVVNLARKMKIDPESALRGTNIRFTRRFKWVEQLARERHLSLQDLNATEWQSLWQEAKQIVKNEA